jgi:hypothetical protein
MSYSLGNNISGLSPHAELTNLTKSLKGCSNKVDEICGYQAVEENEDLVDNENPKPSVSLGSSLLQREQ